MDSVIGFVSKERAEARMNICESCDKLSILKTCNECGCIMPIKSKLEIASCPIKKW